MRGHVNVPCGRRLGPMEPVGGVDCGRQRSRPCDGPGLGADNCTGGLCIQSEWGRTSLRPRGQSAGPLGAVGAKRLQDGDAIIPSFMDSVVLQQGEPLALWP
ncbi:unnamed protein product [Arctogadus glacialis]